MIDENNASQASLRRIRMGLMATGLAIAILGAVCITAPLWFTTPVEWLVGGAMCLSGLAGACHLLVGYLASLGRWKRNRSTEITNVRQGLSQSSVSVAERGPVWTLVLAQVAIGSAMLLWPKQLGPFLFLVLLFAVAAEGAILLWASFHFQSLATKFWMWITGGLSVAVALVTLYYWRSPDADHLVGLLLGAKLLLIGMIFFRVGWGASEADLRSAYVGLGSFQDEPSVGSIYAVYYGPAFHCGISVGEGQIIDYLSDGIVRLITWEEFLLGRRAMEWNYPDVPAGTATDISAFARSLAGKFNPYDALKFNCENLSIYCRSVGATTHSGFSQASIGVEFVKKKPLLGSMLHLLNRGASWFLYGAGGPFGKKIGFSMIRIARVLSDWVVARPLRNTDAPIAPKDIYMPHFEERESKS
ncbi:MAG: hypothetical protein ACK553_03435 [Planctomycetota bacterium]|jgi:uncharacterized membrane protein HdeD (DUF308 family)